MAGENVVSVRFGANVEDLRSGAREATSAVQGIQDRLKEFKSEAVSTGRQARFFANELASIIPGADGAKAALRDLIAVGLSGSAIGAAIEGVKLIAALFHEIADEEGKAKESAQKFGDDTGKILEGLTKRVDGLLLSWRHLGETQTLVATGLKEAQGLEIKAAHAATDAQQKLADARVEAREALASQKTAKDFDLLVEAAIRKPAEAYAKSLADLQKAQDDIIAIKAKIAEAAKGEAGEEQRKARENELQQEFADLKATREAESLVSSQLVTKDLDARLKAAEQEAEDERKAREKELKEEFDELRQMREDEALVDPARGAKDLERRQKAAKKDLDELKRTADEVGSAFTRAFSSMIRGATSFDDALKEIALSIVDMVIGALVRLAAESIAGAIAGANIAKLAAISTTEGYIAEAVAGAYASQAFIPIIGPGLGAAAAASTLAELQGMTAPLLAVPPPAAAGADIPVWMNPVIQAHGGEAVMNRPTTEGMGDFLAAWRAGELGGMGGDVHVHVNAGAVTDVGAMQKLVESYGFRQAVRSAVRRGRWEG